MASLPPPLLNAGDAWSLFDDQELEQWIGAFERQADASRAQLREAVSQHARDKHVLAKLRHELNRRQARRAKEEA